MPKFILYVFLVLCLSGLIGCADIFDVTPYDTLPPGSPRDLTAHNIQRWQERSAQTSGPLTIAFTSDPHFYYGDLADVVSHINGDPSIDVVIVPGDISEHGLVKEFEWFTDALMRLNRPWLTVIGNHDHLSNGRIIYEQMFGARNFIVDLGDHRFIFFDDNVWESDVAVDMGWLSNALAGAGDRIPIVIAHIPPHNDQLAGGEGEQLRGILAGHDVPLFIHGHLHGYAEYVLAGGDTHYLCVPWPRNREYVKLRLDAGTMNIQRITL